MRINGFVTISIKRREEGLKLKSLSSMRHMSLLRVKLIMLLIHTKKTACDTEWVFLIRLPFANFASHPLLSSRKGVEV